MDTLPITIMSVEHHDKFGVLRSKSQVYSDNDFINAVRKGDVELVAHFLKTERVDVNFIPGPFLRHYAESNLSPLVLAIQHGNLSIFKLLLSHKDINVNLPVYITKGVWCTPILRIASSGNIVNVCNEMMYELLKHGDVNLDVIGFRGTTAFYNALESGNIFMANMIASYGADLSILPYRSVHADVGRELSARLMSHGFVGSTIFGIPLGFQSVLYFCSVGNSVVFNATLKDHLWLNRKLLILCINRTFRWSELNQVGEDLYRALPTDMSNLGKFICHCWFDVAGGLIGNGIGRLIMQYTFSLCHGYDYPLNCIDTYYFNAQLDNESCYIRGGPSIPTKYGGHACTLQHTRVRKAAFEKVTKTNKFSVIERERDGEGRDGGFAVIMESEDTITSGTSGVNTDDSLSQELILTAPLSDDALMEINHVYDCNIANGMSGVNMSDSYFAHRIDDNRDFNIVEVALTLDGKTKREYYDCWDNITPEVQAQMCAIGAFELEDPLSASELKRAICDVAEYDRNARFYL